MPPHRQAVSIVCYLFYHRKFAMIRLFLLAILFIPLFTVGQEPSTVKSINSFINQIDHDPTIVRKLSDTTTYEQEDGGTSCDSAYHHKECFYKNGQLIKLIAWNKYGNWRNDMLAYYYNNKTIKFSKGESFKGQADYGSLNFAIYYYQDKNISVDWLTPKPDNVLGVATDIFLTWSYSLQKEP
jgi:hypothetical protein